MAHQARLAVTAKDLRQPSLDIDEAPVWPCRHIAEDQAVSNQPVLLVEIRQGTGQVSEFCLHGAAGVMGNEVRHPFVVVNGPKTPSAVEGMEPG